MTEIKFLRLHERPDLWDEINEDLIPGMWPEFIMHDQVAERLWGAYLHRFTRYSFNYLTQDEKFLANSGAIPLPWDGSDERLPAGWDAALYAGMYSTDEMPRREMALCAMGVAVAPTQRRLGLGAKLLQAMKKTAKEEGYRALISPMRPTHKHEFPDMSMDEYIHTKNDPWLATHLKLGAKIVKTCKASMVMVGTVNEWEQWMKIKLEKSGPTIIPYACNRVAVDMENDKVVYEEENVWVKYEL